MKQNFVEDGPRRLAASEEFQAQCRELREKVTAKYSAELSNAGFIRKFFVRYRRHKEYQRELEAITPSA